MTDNATQTPKKRSSSTEVRREEREPRTEGRVDTRDQNLMVIDRETFNLLCRSIHNLTQEYAKVTSELQEQKNLIFQIGQNQANLTGDISNIALALNPAVTPLRRAIEGLEENDRPLVLAARATERMTG